MADADVWKSGQLMADSETFLGNRKNIDCFLSGSKINQIYPKEVYRHLLMQKSFKIPLQHLSQVEIWTLMRLPELGANSIACFSLGHALAVRQRVSRLFV